MSGCCSQFASCLQQFTPGGLPHANYFMALPVPTRGPDVLEFSVRSRTMATWVGTAVGNSLFQFWLLSYWQPRAAPLGDRGRAALRHSMGMAWLAPPPQVILLSAAPPLSPQANVPCLECPRRLSWSAGQARHVRLWESQSLFQAGSPARAPLRSGLSFIKRGLIR